MTVNIECRNVVVRFGATRILDDINWTVRSGTLVTLLGESGAGKTTLLRLLAGLERQSSGQLLIHSTDDPSSSRTITVGMVFQNLALWPHLTARQHLVCVMPSGSRRERNSEAERLLAEVRFPNALRDRRPWQLSGGEAQRLAFGRALACRPQLLLLDEPLAQVDTLLRAELLAQIVRCVRTRNLTAVYVTHSWREAMQVADQITVIRHGQIACEGNPEVVYGDVSSPAVARLTGPVVEIPTQWIVSNLISCAPDILKKLEVQNGRKDLLIVRPQQLTLIEPESRNRWTPVGNFPDGGGWSVILTSEAGRISVPSPMPLDRSQFVGVGLRHASLCIVAR